MMPFHPQCFKEGTHKLNGLSHIDLEADGHIPHVDEPVSIKEDDGHLFSEHFLMLRLCG